MANFYRGCLKQSTGLMLDSLTITSLPTKTTFRTGDTIDTTGMVVTATSGTFSGNVTAHCTIVPQVAGNEEGTQAITVIYGNLSTTFNITVNNISTLEETSWATIKTVGNAGTGSQYWSIGDTKTITVNGNIGDYCSMVNKNLKVYIIEFNYRGDNGIYFQGFIDSSSEIKIAIDDTLYSSSSSNDYMDGRKTFNINHWQGTQSYGGWKGCDLRYDILGSTNVAPNTYGSAVSEGREGYDATSTCATNPVPNTLMSALPNDLRAVLAPWTVYTDNYGRKSTSASTVSASIDYLPLLGSYEMFASPSNVNTNESTYQSQMSYYVNYTDREYKIMYRCSKTSEAMDIWLRSPSISKYANWSRDTTIGSHGNTPLARPNGLCPAFRVA